jgi:phosphate transport system ATP-binding protein
LNNQSKIIVENLSFRYQDKTILDEVNLSIIENCITAITGASGQGKSTFLSCLNRLWESSSTASVTGNVNICLGGKFHNINAADIDLPSLRRKVAMVFQNPNPLPMSIYKNMALPLKLSGFKDKKLISSKIDQALKQANLWDEVKDRLNEGAMQLSGGQQQRLCIARALIMDPEVLLLDEPTSSLDEGSMSEIEQLLLSLKQQKTIILVSHDKEQVARISDHTLFIKEKCIS